MLDTIHDTRYHLERGGGNTLREEYHGIGHVPVFKLGTDFLSLVLYIYALLPP